MKLALGHELRFLGVRRAIQRLLYSEARVTSLISLTCRTHVALFGVLSAWTCMELHAATRARRAPRRANVARSVRDDGDGARKRGAITARRTVARTVQVPTLTLAREWR